MVLRRFTTIDREELLFKRAYYRCAFFVLKGRSFMETKRVLIVMGSRSDLPSMEGRMKQLDDFQVGYEVRVLSAHRTPEAVLELSKTDV